MTVGKPLQVVFYRSGSGTEPVRDWLRRLSRTDKKTIGADIKTVQYGWPLGMPLVRKKIAVGTCNGTLYRPQAEGHTRERPWLANILAQN